MENFCLPEARRKIKDQRNVISKPNLRHSVITRETVIVVLQLGLHLDQINKLIFFYYPSLLLSPL